MATAMSRMDQGMEETLGSPVLPDPIDMSISARCGVVVAKSRRTFESLMKVRHRRQDGIGQCGQQQQCH